MLRFSIADGKHACIPVYKKQYFPSLAPCCLALYVDIGAMYTTLKQHKHFFYSFERTLSQTALKYNYLQCIRSLVHTSFPKMAP